MMQQPAGTLSEDLQTVAREAELGIAPGTFPEAAAPPPTRGAAATLTRNSAINLARLLVTTAVALVLPAYLSHRLPVRLYSAWVLILQLGAYVGYLDFGIQTGIAKYVAEYEARGDRGGANQRASAGFAIMLGAAGLGSVLTLLLAWQVPHLFHELPSALLGDVRLGLLLVGLSLSFGLVCSVPSAIFLGLQQYGVPMVLALVNRVLYTVVILAAVAAHSSLARMGALVALVNVVTGLLQVVVWRRRAGFIRLRLRGLEPAVVRQMLSYCSVLAIWTIGMLCVSGLDVAIVGRYDFAQTAFYSIAILPTNFLIAMIGSVVGPLLPTASALSARQGPAAMGEVLARVTRYSVLLLALSGAFLTVAGYWLLHVWVGESYALRTVAYLRLLVLANAIRNICLPYATMLVATERQRVAIAGAIAEAVSNLAASIWLAQRYGAVGVALGTLIGSVVSIAMHFAVSMHFTHDAFRITRARLFLVSVLRPALVMVPAFLCVSLWWRAGPPALSGPAWVLVIVATLLTAWFVALTLDDRGRLLAWLRDKAAARRPRLTEAPVAAWQTLRQKAFSTHDVPTGIWLLEVRSGRQRLAAGADRSL